MEELNIYEAPELSLIYLEDADILTASQGSDDTEVGDGADGDDIIPW